MNMLNSLSKTNTGDNDNDSDNDSDSDEEGENLKIDNNPVKDEDNLLNDLSIGELTDQIDINIKELKVDDLSNNDENTENTENTENNEIKTLESSSLAINSLDIDKLELSNVDNLSRIIPISDTEGQDLSKKNPNKLRVDELRELVVNKNLISNDEALKLKKSELVKLLE